MMEVIDQFHAPVALSPRETNCIGAEGRFILVHVTSSIVFSAANITFEVNHICFCL
jgi:hypothetical protein